MSAGETSAQDKQALYWLGEKLIQYRHPVSIFVLIVTGMFAYWSFQLKLETSFGDLLPQGHPFVEVHNKYAPTFGGANNVQIMVEVDQGNIFTVPVAEEGRVVDVVVSEYAEYDPALSPNGRWLAYASNVTGQTEIWVKGYPDGRAVRVSRNGGYEPRWSLDGRELFYLQAQSMMAVPVETTGEFSFGSPLELFTGSY